ncbi:MAG: hypothetical protein SH850_01025 [Planctomycetaceae bacterium]|nr:hypothetical protein [Planctomycetaceae bacterium]
MSATLIPREVSEEIFARHLGFSSFDALIDASEPAYSAVGQLWLIATLPNRRWLASPVIDYDPTHQFSTSEAAHEFVAANVD